jgi:hypothetical protein
VASGVYTDVHSHLKPVGYVAPPVFTTLYQVVYIDKLLTIRGGYTDAFSEPPDPQVNPTTLDAEGGGRVIFIYGVITATIEGLRITGGDATGLYGEGGTMHAGGGVYASGIDPNNATVVLRDNQVFENNAFSGGGIYMRYSLATLDDNIIISNTGTFGGGVRLYYSYDAAIISNTIRLNNAISGSGGGLSLTDSDGLISANAIISNTATAGGGGVNLDNASGTTIRENTILSNTIDRGNGGGIFVYGSDLTIARNTIFANTAKEGGGLFLYLSDGAVISNTVAANIADFGGGLLLWYSNSDVEANIITANTALYGSGCGVWLRRSSPRMVNNVVTDNKTGTTTGSGIYVLDGSYPLLLHTTIARNGGNQGYGVYADNLGTQNSTVVVTDTILTGHMWGVLVTSGNTARLEATLWDNTYDWIGSGTILTGTHNTWGDPHFASDGYHLMTGSAATDHGVGVGILNDVDGDARPNGPAYDLGADEWLGSWLYMYLPLVMH